MGRGVFGKELSEQVHSRDEQGENGRKYLKVQRGGNGDGHV